MSGRPAPLVSVILVCRDGMPYLPAALESVVAQTLEKWEIVFVDDGSRDGSAAAARSADPRVRVLEGEGSGSPSAARNQAAWRARGGLLAFLDADDVWYADKLERQVARLRGGEVDRRLPGLVYGDAHLLDPAGEVVGRFSRRFPPAEGEPERTLPRLIDENFIPLSTVLLPAEIFREAGGFDERFGIAADYHLWLRLAATHAFLREPEPLAGWRVHGSNLTRDFRSAYRDNLAVYEDVAGWLPREMGARVRRASAALAWKWAVREALAGRPGKAARAARTASRVGGGAVGAARALLWTAARQLGAAPQTLSAARARGRPPPRP